MAEPNSRKRSSNRDFEIWQRYTQGEIQADIAASYGLTQQAISHIIGKMQNDVPTEERRARQQRALAELDEMREIALDIARREGARPAELPLLAMDRVVAIQNREAKALGTDAVTRVSVDAENLGAEIAGLLGVLGGGAADEPKDGPQHG
jgi:hypothetical protein